MWVPDENGPTSLELFQKKIIWRIGWPLLLLRTLLSEWESQFRTPEVQYTAAGIFFGTCSPLMILAGRLFVGELMTTNAQGILSPIQVMVLEIMQL